MYPKNAASPEPIAIGAVVQISDGAVQTSGCTVRIKPIGVAEGDGGGTTAYSTDGIVLYTPTQAETNYTSFVLIAKKTGCIPVAITVVTTSSSTPGTVLLAPTTHTSAVVPTVSTLTGHTPQTGDSYPLASSGTHGFAALKTLIDTLDNILDTEFPALVTTIGTPAGASIAADLVVIDDFVDALESRLTAARAGYLDNLSAGAAALEATSQTILADTNELQLDWMNGGRLDLLVDAILADTDSLDTTKITTARAAVLTDWIDGGRLDLILDARASQTSVDAVDDILDTEFPALASTVGSLFTTALTQSYRSAGVAPTMAQFAFETLAHLGDCSISGTTKTLNNLAGSAAKTFTLNSSTTPTSITEAT